MQEAEIINNGRETAYYVDPLPVPYESIYGYKKHGFNVYQLAPGEKFERTNSRGHTNVAHGFIKEERVGDENGNVVTVVFYSRMDSWRKRGDLRFFASPEALLIALGKTPLVNRGNTEEAEAKLKSLGRKSPADTPPMMYIANVELNPRALVEFRADPALAPKLAAPVLQLVAPKKKKKKASERGVNRKMKALGRAISKLPKAKKAKKTGRAATKKVAKKKVAKKKVAKKKARRGSFY